MTGQLVVEDGDLTAHDADCPGLTSTGGHVESTGAYDVSPPQAVTTD